VVGGPQDAGGYHWYQLSLMPGHVSGWVAAGKGSTPWIAAVANGKITLASGRDIWTVDDQDGDRQLFAQVREGWTAGSPSWAPDGNAVAISELRQDTELGCIQEGGIAVLDDGGRVVARSSPAPGTYDTGPAWSPDGSQIAFTRVPHTCGTQNQPGFDALYVVPVAGGSERLVVANASGAVWSLAGDAFAYIRFNPEQTAFAGDQRGPEIWTVAADGSRERLLGGRADDGRRERLFDWIAWSPDGSALAYTRAVGKDLGTIEFDLIDTAGRVRPLTSYAGPVDQRISWLADGSGLVYVEQQIGGYRQFISVLSSAGIQVARSEQPDGVPDRLIVSPDGSSLAWLISGTSDLRIQPTAGGAAQTFHDVPGGSIAWQPLLTR